MRRMPGSVYTLPVPAILSSQILNTKKSKKCLSSEKNYDPYDAEEYDNADDFAEEFGDGDYDEGYDDAYDYWEERD